MEKEQIPQDQANEIGISPQESPIEFLLSHMWTTDWVNYTRDQKLAVIDKAKKMEKEQKIIDYEMGYINGGNQKKITGEKYYNETYGDDKK
jgi:uncharacterized ubiquitin-like protein YukD